MFNTEAIKESSRPVFEGRSRLPPGPGQIAPLLVQKVPVLEEIKCTEATLQGKGA